MKTGVMMKRRRLLSLFFFRLRLRAIRYGTLLAMMGATRSIVFGSAEAVLHERTHSHRSLPNRRPH
jgi:hypothetical protein